MRVDGGAVMSRVLHLAGCSAYSDLIIDIAEALYRWRGIRYTLYSKRLRSDDGIAHDKVLYLEKTFLVSGRLERLFALELSTLSSWYHNLSTPSLSRQYMLSNLHLKRKHNRPIGKSSRNCNRRRRVSAFMIP